jgi:hypothetical protein
VEKLVICLVEIVKFLLQSSQMIALKSDFRVLRNNYSKYSCVVAYKIFFDNNNLSLRFAIFTAVTVKSGFFWDVTPCGYCKNPTFRRNLAPTSSE